jgi:hypothetical protein
MWLELPTLHEALGLVGGQQAVLDHCCDAIDCVALFVARTGRVTTKWVVVGVDEVVFQGDRDGSVEEHGAFSLLPPGSQCIYAIMQGESQGC